MLCWSFIFGGSFWVQQISPEKTLESLPRGLRPRWNRTWTVGGLWDAPLCNLLFQGRWARNLHLLLTLASKKLHQALGETVFHIMKKWALIPMLGKQNPSCFVGQQPQSTVVPGHAHRHGANAWQGHGALSVVGWGPPLGRSVQTVKWDSRWPVSHPLLPVNPEGCWLSPRTEVREVILPGGGGEGV